MRNVLLTIILIASAFTAKAQSAYHGGKGDGYASAGVNSVTLALDENDEGCSVLHIYPNPCQHTQLLTISYSGKSTMQAVLIDATGRQALPLAYLSAEQHNYSFPLAVPPGVYMLRCSSSNSVSEQKVVVY